MYHFSNNDIIEFVLNGLNEYCVAVLLTLKVFSPFSDSSDMFSSADVFSADVVLSFLSSVSSVVVVLSSSFVQPVTVSIHFMTSGSPTSPVLIAVVITGSLFILDVPKKLLPKSFVFSIVTPLTLEKNMTSLVSDATTL